MAQLNTEADPKAVEDAQAMWVNFTVMVKYSSVAIAALLVMMLVFLY